ncbi:hypothetical protein [Microbacterium sp. CFBP9034]|uniref:hypothetical protein n=1 Tax=Microbacterium sp. CFBP9034 TaxID=3096540 RepID=UPI002A6AA6EB|nr:hypothetical protein [Microbacterium sp. CFBP9034]MDY0910912.1 hypothetical protein [Microbacterium sp. CFBP9034]
MSSNRRQRIERVPGSRRAKLTPAPGTSPEPVPADDEETADAAAPADAASGAVRGPNDDQLRRDVPPHY